MKVWCLTATCGRHHFVERTVRYFLDQDYAGEHNLLIYNNSEVSQTLKVPELPVNKGVILINNHLDLQTGVRYNNLGAIYRDMLQALPMEAEVVCFWDDDDIFLPNHITEGVYGLVKGGKSAYKPFKSYYRHRGGVVLMNNTLEPSIFVKTEHLRKYGFKESTTDQHLQWVDPLVHNNDIVSDPNGVPTMIYNWGDHLPSFKTSGDANNPANFENYRYWSDDHDDEVITPITSAEEFYSCINKYNLNN